MSKVVYVNSCVQCPYGEVDIIDILYCRRSGGKNIGYEDKVKQIPRWCELKDIPANNRKKAEK